MELFGAHSTNDKLTINYTTLNYSKQDTTLALDHLALSLFPINYFISVFTLETNKAYAVMTLNNSLLLCCDFRRARELEGGTASIILVPSLYHITAVSL